MAVAQTEPVLETRVPRWLRLALIAAPVVLLLVMGWQRRWVTDDAFINFRVVKQLRAGNGLVFNAGERVEAGTSLAWLLILAAVHLVTPFKLEWISVVLGLLCSVGGLLFAELGAITLYRNDEARRPLFVPFGALIIAAVPAMWDFATSGLETGLAFLWLGGSFWLLARERDPARQKPHATATAFVLGFGPVIRPDFAIFSVVFVAALVITRWNRPVRHRVALVAVAFALPVASELFRMAYYSSLVPNTALAKEAGRSNWSQGWHYLVNFLTPYGLLVPIALMVAVLGLSFSNREWRTRTMTVVVLAPVVAGFLHALYIVRLGGDFMHARFLLPALFAIAMPIAIVPVRNATVAALAGATLIWAVVCGVFLRPVVTNFFIVDERQHWVGETGVGHPITADDYRKTLPYAYGLLARELVRDHRRVLALPASNFAMRTESSLAPGVRYAAVVEAGQGVPAYVAPVDAYVLNGLGLSDPIASRLDVKVRGRPGHEKSLAPAWMLARFAAPGESVDNVSSEDVANARVALACSRMQTLFRHTSGALGPGDLISNVFEAPALTSLHIPEDPLEAALVMCRR